MICSALMLQPFVESDSQAGADTLEDLYQHDQQNHRKYHNQIFVAVIPVVDCDLAQTPAADDTAHGRVAQNRGDGNCYVGDQRGYAFRYHNLNNNLKGGRDRKSVV